MTHSQIKKLEAAAAEPAEHAVLLGLDIAYSITSEHEDAWRRIGHDAEADACRHLAQEIKATMFAGFRKRS